MVVDVVLPLTIGGKLVKKATYVIYNWVAICVSLTLFDSGSSVTKGKPRGASKRGAVVVDDEDQDVEFHDARYS